MAARAVLSTDNQHCLVWCIPCKHGLCLEPAINAGPVKIWLHIFEKARCGFDTTDQELFHDAILIRNEEHVQYPRLGFDTPGCSHVDVLSSINLTFMSLMNMLRKMKQIKRHPERPGDNNLNRAFLKELALH